MAPPCGEISIPVPWGTIAGKTWGKESYSPILVLHGVQDNCGSFDRLIPLLPDGFYYVCIDLPGHGMSSHFLTGVPLEFFNYVYSAKLVIDYQKWNKLKIMGHSLGAQIAVIFSSLYPDLVESVVLIDADIPIITDVHKTASYMRKIYDELQIMEKKISSKKMPVYTYEEALEKLKNNRIIPITDEGAECLIKRALVPVDGGHTFSVDQRLKAVFRPTFTMPQMKNFIDCLKCNILMISAKESLTHVGVIVDEFYHERLCMFFSNINNLIFFLVEGNHNVHINNPERIVPCITSFLLKPNKSSM